MMAPLSRLNLLPALALALLAAPAAAQPPAPQPPNRPASGIQASLGWENTTPPPYALTTNMPSYTPSPTIVSGGGPWGYGPFGYAGDFSASGYLRGAADLTAATGQ